MFHCRLSVVKILRKELLKPFKCVYSVSVPLKAADSCAVGQEIHLPAISLIQGGKTLLESFFYFKLLMLKITIYIVYLFGCNSSITKL